MKEKMILLAMCCLIMVASGCSSHKNAANPAPVAAVPEHQAVKQPTTTGNQMTATARRPAATPGPETVNAMAVYPSREYHVSLQYPATWKQSSLYSTPRYGGSDGYFGLDAAGGTAGGTAYEIAEVAAHHHLKPFGSNPSIERLQIAGQEACLIKPSADQDQQAFPQHMSELVVKYPKAVQIGGNTYYYFLLYADQSHIDSISRTIKFLY